jgi:hypothetical protein
MKRSIYSPSSDSKANKSTNQGNGPSPGSSLSYPWKHPCLRYGPVFTRAQLPVASEAGQDLQPRNAGYLQLGSCRADTFGEKGGIRELASAV